MNQLEQFCFIKMATANHFSKRSAFDRIYMTKSAWGGNLIDAATGSENNFERGAGALSFIPGIGFLGNLGQAGSQLIHGHPWKALGNTALAAGSFFTGGLANDAIKGGLAAGRFGMTAGRLGRAVPSFTKGFGSVNNAFKSVPKSIMGTKPFQNPGFQSFAKNYPSQWVSGGAGSSMKGFGPGIKNFVGTSAVRNFTDKMDYSGSGMEAKDKMFDTASNIGSNVGNFLPSVMGQNADPRMLTPHSMPAPFSPMFN
jgi:hypothetical protein